MAMYSGIRHLHLKVADVERSVRFYREAFDMEVADQKADGRMAFLATPGGGDLLTLCDAELDDENVTHAVEGSRGRAGDNGGIDHIGFALTDQNQLDAAIEKVLAAGGELVRRFDLAPGFETAFVRDLDGYAIQI
jgi:catechol 2,3-dioxygenase-like lactoylglutathione lyase family enzyme